MADFVADFEAYMPDEFNGEPYGKTGLSGCEPDEYAQVLQGLLIAVEEAFLHCLQALNFSSLWDTETIENNCRESPI